jgi:HSP20 family protein
MKFSKNILLGFGLAMLLAVTNVNAGSTVLSLENDPIFKDFQKLHEDMNKIFESFNQKFFNDLKVDEKFFEGSTFTPKADLKDRGKYYEVKVDLPGVEKSETKVKVEKNILTIDAKSEKSEVKKDDKMIKKERFIGVFHKVLTLPDDANGDKLTTSYENGVLTVKIPKK